MGDDMSQEQETTTDEAAAADATPDGASNAAAEESPATLEHPSLAESEDSLREELEEAKQKLLRSHADLENFRKRSSRELANERRYAAMPLLHDLLPVVDDIHRAIAAAGESDSESSLLQGFRLVAQQLTTVLKKHDCTEIPAQGEAFDPNVHEAISYLPSADHEPNTVMQVTSTGYMLHDRVVRPSQVIVAAAPPKTDS